MSTPKPEIRVGDRVRVEFEGKVTGTGSGGYVHVRPDGMADLPAPLSACTVIAPPVAVGDVVTAENIGQLPGGSIVAEPRNVALTKCGDAWRLPGLDRCAEFSDREVAHFGAVVLRVGGGA